MRLLILQLAVVALATGLRWQRWMQRRITCGDRGRRDDVECGAE